MKFYLMITVFLFFKTTVFATLPEDLSAHLSAMRAASEETRRGEVQYYLSLPHDDRKSIIHYCKTADETVCVRLIAAIKELEEEAMTAQLKFQRQQSVISRKLESLAAFEELQNELERRNHDLDTKSSNTLRNFGIRIGVDTDESDDYDSMGAS